ncbi:MAG: ydaF 2 [Acidimicrobiales bacterium]|nr:ydaF 2 [Acidimicrobiales bacterium]
MTRRALLLPTARLVDEDRGVELRAWNATPGDVHALVSAWAEPAVRRWCLVPDTVDAQAAARWIDGGRSRLDAGRAVDLVVVEPGRPHEPLGEVGLAVVEVERGWAELGYWLALHARGVGRATAAVQLFSTWALRELPITRLFAQVDPENPAAGAVVERAGYTVAGTAADGRQVWVRDRVG